MQCVIQTVPGRSTANFRGPSARVATKYAQVQRDHRFKFVPDLTGATVFDSVPEAIKALGLRAQQVNKITDELTIAEVEVARPTPTPPIKVKQILNGSKVTPANHYAPPRW